MIQLNQYISEKLNIDKDVKDIPEEELYKQYFETLKDKFKKEGINATGTFKKLFGDYNSQWIRLSYLKPEDEPNIADNGMYLIFDINFKTSFEILKQEDYINKMLNRYNMKDEQSKKELEEIRNIANKYVEQKTKESE